MLWRSLKSLTSDMKFIVDKLIAYTGSYKLTEIKAKLLVQYITDPSFKPNHIQRVSGGGKGLYFSMSLCTF